MEHVFKKVRGWTVPIHENCSKPHLYSDVLTEMINEHGYWEQIVSASFKMRYLKAVIFLTEHIRDIQTALFQELKFTSLFVLGQWGRSKKRARDERDLFLSHLARPASAFSIFPTD